MDRQDIDALLIGALYGELTPADEARLSAHLESHPTDRGALDDLKTARRAVRESRIFELQLDPPQAVSALLLQEAHRRAPKRVVSSDAQEGWFARFVRSFVAHPAMAAAASLVLVLGFAGIMFMKKGADYTHKTAGAPPETADRAQAETTMAPGPEVVAGAGSASAGADQGGSGYRADLYEGRGDLESMLDGKQDEAKAKVAKESASDRWRDTPATPPAKKQNKGIAVTTEQMQPKDLDDLKNERKSDSFERQKSLEQEKSAAVGTKSGLAFDPSGGARGGGGSIGTGATAGPTATTVAPNAPTGNAGYAQPPAQIASDDYKSSAPSTNKPADTKKVATPSPKPEPPKVAGKAEAPSKAPPKVAAKPPAATDKAPASPTPPPPPAEAKPAAPSRDDAALLAWAKSEHKRTVSLAKTGKCAEAAKLALGVSNKAPDYYSQYMATDRDLKSCQQYIQAERDKDAEKSGKSRAQKRVNADEPALNAK